ncbi:MAG: DUF6318 family protein, partial [Pedococcus sp.]
MTAVVLGGALVAGCSDGGDPPPSTTSTSSSTSSSTTSGPSSPSSSTTSSATSGTSSSSSTVAVPAAASKKTPEGAEAFARFYWEEASKVLVTNDPTRVESLSATECAVCKAFGEVADKQIAQGHHAEKDPFQIKLATWTQTKQGRSVVEVAGNEIPVRTLNANGGTVRTSKAGVITWQTTMIWTEGRW